MTPEQREELKQAAMKATPGDWKISEELGVDEAYCDWHGVGPFALCGGTADADSRYISAANPATILSLIAQVEALEAKFVIGERPADEQQWAKVDPAVAFHLIERHADNWNEAGDMMVAWADARHAAKVEALTVPQGWQMVPVEPTPEMFEAAGESLWGYTREEANEWAKLDKFESQADRGVAAYAAMLDAAPTIPAIPGTKEGA